MTDIPEVLVGIAVEPDGEILEGSRSAVQHGAALARALGAPLAILHSTWTPDLDAELGPEPSDAVRANVSALAAEAGFAEASIAFTGERPWIALIQRCLRLGSEHVVVARRDRAGATDGRTFGTNTLRLLRKCPAALWTVVAGSRTPYRKILAATDLSEVGDRVTRWAGRLAKLFDSQLHIAHAWQRGMEMQLELVSLSPKATAARIHAHEDELRERIRTALGDEAGSIEPHLHVGCAAPENLLLRGAEELAPDLVVMGTLSRTGVPGMLMGNTAERLVHRLPCSLLTLKPADFESPVVQ